MITVLELCQWLATLPAGASVGVDDGGLTLRHALVSADKAAYLEIGGLPDLNGDPLCTCGICEWQGPESKLKCKLDEIHHLAQRLEPGAEVPAGECPECGGLCYLEANK